MSFHNNVYFDVHANSLGYSNKEIAIIMGIPCFPIPSSTDNGNYTGNKAGSNSNGNPLFTNERV